MMREGDPNQSDWYAELISSMDGREVGEEETSRALEVVKTTMSGVEAMLGEDKIINVQVSFEVVEPEGNLEFNYSAPKEEE